MSHEWDTESTHSDSSFDEDEVNIRVYPDWTNYRNIIERGRLYRLDTCRDVREHYEQYCVDLPSHVSGYFRACSIKDDNALCKDAGLPDNLFRGSRVSDGMKIVVKAVHLRSREYDIVHFLSTFPQRSDPMNHCIPVLDMIPISEDDVGLIVMAEWQLMTDPPCCLRLFLGALQQCVDHTVFMHRYHIAHLDISVRNILTDNQGHYAYIDYEMSRRFNCPAPRIQNKRATEITPESERGESSDPYKADVWALAILMLRACQSMGFHIPELLQLTRPMLHDNPDERPSARMVQKAFDSMIPTILQEHDTINGIRNDPSFPPIRHS